MAGERSEDRPYRDTLRVPSVLVMPGDPWPAEFYARYPQAFRVPVRIVWRDRPPSRDDAPPLFPSATSSTVSTPLRGMDATVAEAAPEPSGPLRADAAPEARASYVRGDPVGAFLRINDALDRRQGKPALAEGTPHAEGRLTPRPDHAGIITLIASTRDQNYAARMLGYDRNLFRRMIHLFKDEFHLAPNDHVILHDTGDLYFGEKLVGNINDFAP